jgi:hypothetical protein
MFSSRWQSAVGFAAVAASVLLLQNNIHAQGRGRGGGPPATPKAAAPIDLTGYWVAEITEDWRWRMVTPAKGDWESVPMNAESQAIADKWDPDKEATAPDQCKAYGAPALMRAPTRLHITWVDDNTLSVESDYGQQKRMVHFGNWKPTGSALSLQGDSVAHWEAPGGRGNVRPNSGAGSLVVNTKNLRPGFLRKNGIPYSAATTMTEYWDLVKEYNGDQRILLLIEVDDPMYLNQPWIVPVHFKKEPDGAKWDPSQCSAVW